MRLEDVYKRQAYYDAKGEANKLRVPKAFHIMGTLNPDGGIFLTHGIIDLKEFLARVTERGVDVYKRQGLVWRTICRAACIGRGSAAEIRHQAKNGI